MIGMACYSLSKTIEAMEKVLFNCSHVFINYFVFTSFSGYECEAHNNPADFFLDVINGDSTAVQMFGKGKQSSSVGQS